MEIFIKIALVERPSTSPGPGSQRRRRRRSAPPLCDELKMAASNANEDCTDLTK
jgi:hypothetical protein